MTESDEGTEPAVPADGERQVHAYVTAQRWFAGKGRSAELRSWAQPFPWLNDPGEEPAVRIELVEFAYDDGTTETYQVPMAYYSVPQEHLSHAFVGEWAVDVLDPAVAYDALHDRDATRHLLRGLLEERSPDGLRFHSTGLLDPEFDQPSLLMTGEQSNSSLAFSDEAILKVFRKLAPGRNPDIEVHRVLTERGVESVAALYGWIEGRWHQHRAGDGPETADLAMLQQFLRTATDGWTLALTSVRDLYAEGDLYADEVGGDFAPESHRLGVVVAEIHRHLADALGTGSWGADDIGAAAAAMHRRLDDAVQAVPELGEYADGLRPAYEDLAALDPPLPVQRVHGDLHLGQTLRTVKGWKLIDFEGEPAKPLAERVAFDVPMRDVAGMLRSFDYAAANLLMDHPGESQLRYRAREWADRNRAAFCDGYAEGSDLDPARQQVLIRAYETDKAVYEVVYEFRNRPSWLSIPMLAVRRLAGVPEEAR